MDDDRNASINNYVNSLDWSDANKAASAAALSAAAKEYGVSAADIAAATGYKTGDVYTLMGGYQPTNTGVADDAAKYGWDSNYTRTQDDMVSIRNYMKSSGQPYVVTGNASMADGGNSVASLPGWLNQSGIKASGNMLESYKGVTGLEYKPGQTTTGYTSTNNGNGGYYTIRNPDGTTTQSKPVGYGGYAAPAASQSPGAYTTKPGNTGGLSGSGVANTGAALNQANGLAGVLKDVKGDQWAGLSGSGTATTGDALKVGNGIAGNINGATPGTINLASMAGIGSGVDDAIRQQIAGLNGKTQAELDAWFRTTNMDAATIARASGYKVEDVQAAMDKARASAPAASNAPVTPAVIAAIQGEVASLNGKTQTELDAWFRSTPYTAAQIAAASGYKESDVQAAMDKARGTTTKPGTTATSPNGAPVLNTGDINGPTNWTVDGNQLVQNQLANIMAGDSPLMQQARTRALQAMNERGTLNSSMATSAAESAMYDAAMPIAQADAGTNASAAQTNAGYANAFTQDANAFTRSGIMANFNLGANEWAAQQQHVRDLETARINAAANADANKTNSSTQFDQQNRQGYINGINQARNDWAEKFAALNANSDISPEVRNATLKSLAATYNTQIKQYAALLGWDYNSWDIEYVDDTPPPATTPPPASTYNGGGSGGG